MLFAKIGASRAADGRFVARLAAVHRCCSTEDNVRGYGQYASSSILAAVRYQRNKALF